MDEGRLDRLPVGTVALDRHSEAWQRVADGLWMVAGSDLPADTDSLVMYQGPIRVLWVPTDGE